MQCRTIREDELIKVKVYLNGIFYIQNNIVVTLSRVLSLGPVGTTANIEYITKIVYQSYVTIPEGTKVRLTQKDGTIVDQSKTYLLTKMEDNTYQFTVPNNDLKLGVLKVKTLINENDENAEENFLSNINWIVMYYQLSAITGQSFSHIQNRPSERILIQFQQQTLVEQFRSISINIDGAEHILNSDSFTMMPNINGVNTILSIYTAISGIDFSQPCVTTIKIVDQLNRDSSIEIPFTILPTIDIRYPIKKDNQNNDYDT